MKKSKIIEAMPAYGRQYTTPAAALVDFDADKDFRELPGGPYFNKSDLEKLMPHVAFVNVRCGGQVRCVIEKVAPGKWIAY